MVKIDDLHYWQKFLHGDTNALSNIYILYVDDLYAYGMKIYSDEAFIKDAIQEIFISFIEKQKTLTVSKNVKAYIFKTLRNKILEELRTRNRKTEIDTLIFNSETDIIQNMEQLLISNEEDSTKLIIIKNALSQLSKTQKEAIYLRFTNDNNYEQIAEIMSISVPSARTLIYRSIKQMREFIFNRTQKTFPIYFLLTFI